MALLETCQETFPGPGLPVPWVGTTGKSGIYNGGAGINTDNSYPALFTNTTVYDARGSFLFAQIFPGLSASSSVYAMAWGVETLNGGDKVKISMSNGVLTLEIKNSATGLTATTTLVNYNATAHAWWKMTFAANGSSVTIAFSPDSGTWNDFGTYSLPNASALSAVQPKLSGGANNASAAASWVYIDNVNTATVVSSNPLMGSEHETFDSSLGGFTGTNGAIGVENGQAYVLGSSSYPSLATQGGQSVKGSGAFAKINPGRAANAAWATIFAIAADNGTAEVKIICDYGTMRLERVQNGTTTTDQLGNYNATTQAWWQLLFNSGATSVQVLFSADGNTWNTVGNYALTASAGFSASTFRFNVGNNTGDGTTAKAYLDNFNVAGSAPVPAAFQVGGLNIAPTTGGGTTTGIRPFVSQSGAVGTPIQLKKGSDAGTRLKLTGVNVWGVAGFDQYHFDFMTGQYNNRTTVINTIQSWGANHIRLRLDANTNGYNAQAWGLSKAQYIQRVVDWVNLAKSKGLYVMICWWDAYNAAGNWPTRYTETFEMMAAVVNAIGKDEPYVYYEIGNEPNNIDWPGWQTAVKGTLSHFRNTLNYTGFIMVDTINWSHGYSDSDMRAVESYDANLNGMGGKHQIAYAKHDYGNEYANLTWDRNKWYSDTGGSQNYHLIMETEFGNYNVGTVSGESWVRGISGHLSSTAFTERNNFIGSSAFLFGPWVDDGNVNSNGMTASDNVNYAGGYQWGKIVNEVLLVSSAVS